MARGTHLKVKQIVEKYSPIKSLLFHKPKTQKLTGNRRTMFPQYKLGI